MAGVLNIGGDKNDTSYRYKMPGLIRKIEGRGNGIKTVMVNMVDIAKALKIDPGYPTKFLGVELGAQSTWVPETERSIVNGAHEANDLQEILGKFIDIFILCPTCKLPEIKHDVKKSSIKIDCAACGHNGKMTTTHKLVTYILNHPPNKGKEKDSKGGKSTKAERQAKRNKKKDEGDDEGDEEEEGKKEKEPKSEKADRVVKDDKDKEKKAVKKEKVDVEWFTDTSKEAQEARKMEEFKEMATRQAESKNAVDAILSSAKNDGKMESPVTVLKIYIASKTCSIDEISGELRRLELSRGLDAPQKMKVLLESIIDVSELKTVPEQFKKHAKLLKAVANDNADILIGAVEDLIGVIEPKLMPRVPMIFQALYETDVLDEESLLEWHQSPAESSWLVNKEVAFQIREKATPFMQWLQSAESGSDDE